MQEIGDFPLHKNFEYDDDKDALENLVALLEEYGLEDDEDLPVRESGELIDVESLYQKLPETVVNGGTESINSAREELKDLTETVPQRQRMKEGGFWTDPQWVLERLFDRLEYFADFADRMIRTCRGPDCGVYDECPFAHMPRVKSATAEDDTPCMVDRSVVQGAIDDFINPSDPEGGKVDPRRPAQGMLFEQLVQQLVLQARLRLQIQGDEMLVEHREALQIDESGVEQFAAANDVEHPLLERIDKVTHRINELTQKMGIAPEFEMRQDRWIDNEGEKDPELEGANKARRFLREANKEIKENLPEGSPEREAADKVVAEARKRLDQAVEDEEESR